MSKNITDYDELYELEQEFYMAQGFSTDIKCHFYYDESNNCRKFWIKTKENVGTFNVNQYEDFVLAGVVAVQDTNVKFEDFRDKLELQKNVNEVKFKNHFSYGDFLSSMNRRRVTYFFDWINENGLLIHYINVNNFYYAIVEIIDSVMQPKEIDDMGFDYYSIKSTFYEMLRGKEMDVQNLMFRYEFPNIKKDKIYDFITELVRLFPPRYQQTPEQKFITGMIDGAKNKDELVFLNDNIDFVMQENYVEFYYDHPRKYRNSFHTFDNETQIESNDGNSKVTYLGVELDNMEYVDSKTNVMIQASDVIAGIWAQFMIYINNKTSSEIRKDVEKLTDIQIRNIDLLRKIRIKSDGFNRGFLMSVTAQSVIDRINFFFDLCNRKK